MYKVFKIYLIICGVIISIAIIAGLIALTLNIIAYAYESYVGFGTFKKFLKKYHREMEQERTYRVEKKDIIK